jgi:hypothetical protein
VTHESSATPREHYVTRSATPTTEAAVLGVLLRNSERGDEGAGARRGQTVPCCGRELLEVQKTLYTSCLRTSRRRENAVAPETVDNPDSPLGTNL